MQSVVIRNHSFWAKSDGSREYKSKISREAYKDIHTNKINPLEDWCNFQRMLVYNRY